MIIKRSLLWIGMVVIVISVRVSALAGVAVGPVLTNAVDAKQHKISVFYEAQKSYEEKLKVGQERYKAMQTNRANAIAGMNTELAAREQAVDISSLTTSTTTEKSEGHTWYGTLVGVAAVGLALFGFQYYLSRLNSSREDSKYEITRKF